MSFETILLDVDAGSTSGDLSSEAPLGSDPGAGANGGGKMDEKILVDHLSAIEASTDEQGLMRKRDVIDAALARNQAILGDPLRVAAALGGRELAAILGATLAARRHLIPVLLDGFVATAAAAPKDC